MMKATQTGDPASPASGGSRRRVHAPTAPAVRAASEAATKDKPSGGAPCGHGIDDNANARRKLQHQRRVVVADLLGEPRDDGCGLATAQGVGEFQGRRDRTEANPGRHAGDFIHAECKCSRCHGTLATGSRGAPLPCHSISTELDTAELPDVRQHHPADVAVRLDPVLRDVTEKLLGHSPTRPNYHVRSSVVSRQFFPVAIPVRPKAAFHAGAYAASILLVTDQPPFQPRRGRLSHVRVMSASPPTPDVSLRRSERREGPMD